MKKKSPMQSRSHRDSNSSGPCACIHLLLVSIVMSFTLRHVYTRKRNKQTLRSRSSLSFKMHSQSWILILSNRWKRFRIPGRRLFLEPDQWRRKMINWTTTVLTAVMKLIRKLTPMMTLTSQIVIHLSDRKCRHLRPKHVDVHSEITEIHAPLLSKL